MRKHALSPARRIVLAMLSTTSVVALLFGYHTSTAGSLTGAGAPAGTSVVSGTLAGSGTTGTVAGDTGSPSAGSSAGSSSSSSSDSGLGDSASTTTVAGDTAQTQWGPVQVQLAVSHGTITGVDVLQYPSGNGKDQEINAYALPILVQETLDAQSADLDMVSGATVTSGGYLESLQSALDQAGL
jgi:uncharacterized protein with FMN-binding domain